MSGPESIPEDRQESFPCQCCGGDITLIDGVWQCDTCNAKPGEEDE